MNEQKHKRDAFQGNQRNAQNMEHAASSSSLESQILARLGMGNNGTEDWQIAIRRIEQIVIEGKPDAIKQVAPYLSYQHKAVRAAAVRGLHTLSQRNPGSVPIARFVEALSDASQEVRIAAIEALTSRRLPRDVFEFLTKTLASKSDDGLVRMMIVHLLGSSGKDAPFEALASALDDPDWQVREAAVLKLGEHIDYLSDTQRARLEAKIFDDEFFVRDAALFVLDRQWATDSLLAALRSTGDDRRIKAARALSEMYAPNQWDERPRELGTTLIEIARDRRESGKVREAALQALAELREPAHPDTLTILQIDSNTAVSEAALNWGHALFPRQYPLEPTTEDIVHPPKVVPPNVTNIRDYQKERYTSPEEMGEHNT